MSHLSTERLAALVDEQPSADENTHLTHCADCARELDAHRSVVAMAGSERDAMQLPLTRWETLSQRLRTEGLIAFPKVARTRTTFLESRAMLQVAAALLLVAGGAVLGRFSAGASAIPGGMTNNRVGTSPVDVSAVSPDSLPTTFASIEEATRWRSAYADAYQRTVTFLAANDSAARQAETPAVMRARLSALDRVSRTMREALNDAPYDPVINDFYLNSFGQREATLRQLNTVLPQGVRLNSF
jgi:hypothetical protein